MTMTDAERETISRSSPRNAPSSTLDRLNLKFDNCSGRLECMS